MHRSKIDDAAARFGRPRGGANPGPRERFDAVVIGGGQAGLSVGYHLARRGLSFVVLDAAERTGDSWRNRWDSLRLFTPARFDGLDGMPFPARSFDFPTKDEMADYLEAYAERFSLPVRHGARVERLTREGSAYTVAAAGRMFEAAHVVVAMSTFQEPRVPAFAAGLDPAIVQLHSREYRNPSQLEPGPALVVGAGNSGAEIALEIAGSHRTWLSGRDPGHVPFRVDGFAARFLTPVLLRGVFHRVLTVATPLGRLVRRRVIGRGGPVIRVKPRDLERAGIERVPRIAGVRNGAPLLEDRRTLDVVNVVWCTGFHPGFSWIDLPVHGENGEPRHEGGIVPDEPGLYFVGLNFLYALSSTMVHGVGRDAERIASTIAERLHASSATGDAGLAETLPLAAGASAK